MTSRITKCEKDELGRKIYIETDRFHVRRWYDEFGNRVIEEHSSFGYRDETMRYIALMLTSTGQLSIPVKNHINNIENPIELCDQKGYEEIFRQCGDLLNTYKIPNASFWIGWRWAGDLQNNEEWGYLWELWRPQISKEEPPQVAILNNLSIKLYPINKDTYPLFFGFLPLRKVWGRENYNTDLFWVIWVKNKINKEL